MNERNDKLTALLKQWRDIEPKANFEANVRRRIRLAQTEAPETVTLAELLRRWLWQPASSVAAAAVLGLVVGVWGGISSTPRPEKPRYADTQFLGGETLAGSYLRMASGGAR